jgi:hypothetical protein
MIRRSFLNILVGLPFVRWFVPKRFRRRSVGEAMAHYDELCPPSPEDIALANKVLDQISRDLYEDFTRTYYKKEP